MKFGQELRRRHVYRLAGLYIVEAWLIIQVAEMLFRAWGVPESALRYLFLALNRAMLGNYDGALQAFERAVELGWIDYYRVLNSPVWASTVASPDFQRLLSKVKVEVDRQRAIVEAIDAEDGFREDFERILAPLYAKDENP